MTVDVDFCLYALTEWVGVCAYISVCVRVCKAKLFFYLVEFYTIGFLFLIWFLPSPLSSSAFVPFSAAAVATVEVIGFHGRKYTNKTNGIE